jgi:hypothetical protein
MHRRDLDPGSGYAIIKNLDDLDQKILSNICKKFLIFVKMSFLTCFLVKR